MKKALVLFATAAALIVSGCAVNLPANSSQAEPSVPADEAQSSEQSAPPQSSEEESSDPMAGITLDEYDGLKITAAVLPRKAILPGSVFPVAVIISNEGDKTISYINGSGSYETPTALITEFDGLQPIVSKDRLGAVTSDFGVKQLAPGEKLSFVVNVLAAEPDEQFYINTHELYNNEQIYIAELEWTDLQARYPELSAAKPGSYTGAVSFQYSIYSDENAIAMFGEPTGYARAEVAVGVTGE